jgi:hypothetical protein
VRRIITAAKAKYREIALAGQQHRYDTATTLYDPGLEAAPLDDGESHGKRDGAVPPGGARMSLTRPADPISFQLFFKSFATVCRLLLASQTLVFHLTERPVIRRIEYRAIRSIAEQDLLRAHKEKKIGLSMQTYLDQEELARAADVIKELLAARGHPSATVVPACQKIPATSAVTILFQHQRGTQTEGLTSSRSTSLAILPLNHTVSQETGPNLQLIVSGAALAQEESCWEDCSSSRALSCSFIITTQFRGTSGWPPSSLSVSHLVNRP